MRQAIVLGAALVLATVGGAPVCAQTGARHVRASLVAETDAVQPGKALVVGVHLEMEEGWHTYWRNPGDSGLATKVRWEVPEGFSVGELQWPRPIRFTTGPLVSYGYEHRVLHPARIRVPDSVPGDEISLTARLSWLECRDVCLPGKADLALTLPVREATKPGAAASLFAEASREMPVEDGEWTFAAAAGEGAIDLMVQPPPGTSVSEAYFFPIPRRVLDYSKPQPLAREEGAYRLELARDPNGEPSVPRLAGVLVATTPDGEMALEVDVPVSSQEETKP
jgi:DsbC/DsbD-like thiol-disulfide interchange protein